MAPPNVDDPANLNASPSLASPPPPVEEAEFDFVHLVEETRFHGVEAAAVRESEGGLVMPAHLSAAPLPPPPPPIAAASPPTTPWSAQDEQARAELAPSVPRGVQPAPDASGPLIRGVPSVGPSRVGRVPVDAAAIVQGASGGDHDGHTVSAAALRLALSGNRPGRPAPEMPSAAPQTEALAQGPHVQAVHCEASHPSPPHAPLCRWCGGPIVDRLVRMVGRPVLGRLRFTTGMVIDLDRPQLIGRRPTATRALAGAEIPGLVTIPDPDQSLSRVHVEVRIEGWDMFVIDRESMNGTFVEVPGQTPVKLRSGEPFLVSPGCRVSLADVTTFVYDVGPA